MVCIRIICFALAVFISAFAPAYGDELRGERPKMPPKELDVRLIDADGNPVEGAGVSVFASFGSKFKPSERSVTDETGWRCYPRILSDSEGKVHLSEEDPIFCVIARHIEKKLIAIQAVDPDQRDKTLTLTMLPECKIHGRLTSKEMESVGRKFVWSNVYLYLDGKRIRPMSCQSEKGEFHFFVPPGKYNLRAYTMDTHTVERAVEVRPNQTELDAGTIDMPPHRFVMLINQPAPELQEVAGWKNGGPLKLADLHGKVVLLDFWHYQCGPCVREMPEIFDLYDKYHDQGLEVIAIHTGSEIDTPAKLDEKIASVKELLWKGRDFPFPVAMLRKHDTPYRPDMELKAGSLVEADYGITGIPTGVLIDRQGRVVGTYNGKPAEIERLLKEK